MTFIMEREIFLFITEFEKTRNVNNNWKVNIDTYWWNEFLSKEGRIFKCSSL